MDGEENEATWATDTNNERFDCKDIEWVPIDGESIAYLGTLMSIDSDHTFLEMYDISVHINNTLEIMEWAHHSPVSRPCGDSINIDGESPKLNYDAAKRFHTGLGMIGWLNMTCLPDVAHVYSRLGQHQADRTESAMDSLRHCYRYLIGSTNWGLSGSIMANSYGGSVCT